MKKLILVYILQIFVPDICSQTAEKRVYQTNFTETIPVIDGFDSDSCWENVDWSGDFIQSQPEENKMPSQKTEFKILYDENNLYVFIRAHDTEADKISRILSRRDHFTGDMVEINIDSYFDKQTAFSFTAMASGAKGDEAVSRDGQNWDSNWNPVWYLATSIDDKGWSAEMKIPYSQLRFSSDADQVWGIQVTRYIYRLEERSLWQFIPKGSPGTIHLFGELHGIHNIKPRRQIEFLPYLVARTDRFRKEEGNPFADGSSSLLSAGLDGKFGITNDLTIDLTVNPDFGQVEADPSEVNLTAFETYFSEKRPFFVEGNNIFQYQPNQTIVINNMSSDNIFYSRRIGRSPHYSPLIEGDEYIRMPESTTILGAAKLSGKTRKGLSIGVLESITSEENAIIDHYGSRRKQPVEPLTSYFTARLQQDYKKGETVIGGILTSVNRNINVPELSFLPGTAITGGLDFTHYWNKRTWYISGKTEFSSIKGSEESILALQTSSARYFQRPDAEYLSLDSSLTSLRGSGGTIKFGRASDKKFQFETSLTMRSPGLEFNDIGFMRYSDVIHHGSWAAYYIRNPFSIFNNFYLNTNYWFYMDYSGKILSFNTNMNFNSQFRNRWNMNGGFTRQTRNISKSLLRGGPSMKYPGDISYNFNLSSDGSKKLTVSGGTYQAYGDSGSKHVKEFWGGFTYKPFNSVSFSFEPDYVEEEVLLQYIASSDFNGYKRYIFGELGQKTLNMVFRLNYSINPDLTLEYYGQPFISAGRYSNYKIITNPIVDDFSSRYHVFTGNEMTSDGINCSFDEDHDGINDYSVCIQDFNFRQFRSNLVLRWEYRPGSSLYLVWSQGRTSTASSGRYDFAKDMNELFNTVPRNIYLLKFSYWFAL